MKKDQTEAFAKKVFFIIAALGLVALFIYLSHILLLIFGAVLTAVTLRALAKPIETKTHVSTHWSLAIVVIGLTIGLLLTSLLVGSIVFSQLDELSTQTANSWQNLRSTITQYHFGDKLVSEIESFKGNGVLAKIPLAAFSVLGSLANFLIVIVCGVFIAAEPQLYRQGLLKLFPEKTREKVGAALLLSGNALTLWFKGKLISMACIGILVTIVLSILGIPSAFAIGLIAGIGEFIPYIGALISTIPAIMLALMEGPEMVLWVILAIVAVQQLQGNLIMPLVQQRMVSLPPAVTIFSFLIMGFLFGLPGILLAEPLTVFVYVMVKKLYIRDVLGENTKIPGEKARR